MTSGRWRVLLLYTFAIAFAFWFIDHDLNSSEDYELRNDYGSGSINRTADRVENINQFSTLARMFLAGFAFAAMVAIPNTAKLRWNSPLMILIAVWAAFNFSSVLWSVDPRVTILKLGSLAFFLFAALCIARQLDLYEMALVFSSICVIFILIGFAVEFKDGRFRPWSDEYRFVGTCHPNILGGYAAVCCFAAPIFSRGKKRIGFWTLALIALGLTTLVLTKSRTSLAGILLALAAIRSITLKPGTRFIALAGFALMSVALAGYMAISGGNAQSSASSMAAMGRTENIGSLTGRLPLWEELLVWIEKKPIVGHGYLAFWGKERVEYLSDLLGWEIPHGHNMYLDVLLDGGIVGLGLFLAMIATALVVSFRKYFASREFGVAFVFGLTLFVLMHGFGESLFKLHTFLSLIFFTSLLRLGSLPAEDSSDPVPEVHSARRPAAYASRLRPLRRGSR